MTTLKRGAGGSSFTPQGGWIVAKDVLERLDQVVRVLGEEEDGGVHGRLREALHAAWGGDLPSETVRELTGRFEAAVESADPDTVGVCLSMLMYLGRTSQAAAAALRRLVTGLIRSSPDPVLRVLAVHHVVQCLILARGDRMGWNTLVAALDDPFLPVRVEAVVGIRLVGGMRYDLRREAIAALDPIPGRDPDPALRRIALDGVRVLRDLLGKCSRPSDAAEPTTPPTAQLKPPAEQPRAEAGRSKTPARAG